MQHFVRHIIDMFWWLLVVFCWCCCKSLYIFLDYVCLCVVCLALKFYKKIKKMYWFFMNRIVSACFIIGKMWQSDWWKFREKKFIIIRKNSSEIVQCTFILAHTHNSSQVATTEQKKHSFNKIRSKKYTILYIYV